MRLFAGHLEDDEKVILVVHKHWIVGLRALIPPTLSFLLALAVLSAARLPAVFYTVTAWVLASVVWWLRSFFDYYMDAWLITSMGVIDLEWHSWFHRQSSRVLYSDIEGVSYEIKGILGTVLRYGSLTVEKISTGAAISLSHVPRPRAVEAVVLRSKEAYLHAKNMKDTKHVQEVLATLVAEHVQLKDLRSGKAAAVPETDDKEEASAPAANTKPAPKKRGFSSSSIRSSRS